MRAAKNNGRCAQSDVLYRMVKNDIRIPSIDKIGRQRRALEAQYILTDVLAISNAPGACKRGDASRETFFHCAQATTEAA